MTVLYFGPAHARKDYELQTETPVGEPCLHCEEPVQEGEAGTMMPVFRADSMTTEPIHYECSMRSILGSVGHLTKTCSCFGGLQEDPPGMSKRDAALLAVAVWERMQRP